MLLFFVLAIIAIQFTNSDICIPRDCNSINTLNGTKGPYIFRVGTIMTGDDLTAQSLAVWAAFRLNNNLTFLPNVSFQVYTVRPALANASQHIAASLELVINKNVNFAIEAIEETQTATSSQLLSAFTVPTTSIESTTTLYIDKSNFPFLIRSSPPDTLESNAIVRVLSYFNVSQVVYFYTPDEFGVSTFAGFQQEANKSNIFVLPAQYSGPQSTLSMDSDIRKARAIVLNIVDSSLVASFCNYTRSHSLFGPDYLYILTTNSLPIFQDTGAEFLLGSLVTSVASVIKSDYSDMVLQEWQQADNTSFPGSRQPRSWQSFDAVNTFAIALNKLLLRGRTPATISGMDLLTLIVNSTNETMTGSYTFNKQNDRIGVYQIFNIRRNVSDSYLIATVDYLANQSSQNFANFANLANVTFFNGSTENPVYVYRWWEHCSVEGCNNHGRCALNGSCICWENYTGSHCETSLLQGGALTAKDIAPWVVPVGVFLIAVFIAGYMFHKRRHAQLVKQVSERQGSEVTRAEFKLYQRIGRGASGDVYKALFRGTEVAVKSMTISQTNPAVIEQFQLETSIMCSLRHPNIVLFMGSCLDIVEKEMFLIMEFMQRGSLYDVLHNSQIAMPYDLQVHIAVQAALGMNFLHESRPPTIHRDLKSHNILLDEKWNARIADFGTTRVKEVTSRALKKTNHSLGTIYWCAPEVLADAYSYSEKSDCYSFGIVLWEIFHRAVPYGTKDPMAVALEVMQMDIRPEISPSCPEEIQGLMRQCWAQLPNERPNMKDILTNLRTLSSQNPLSEETAQQALRIGVPISTLYVVHTEMQAVNTLWETAPRAFQVALLMHNQNCRHYLEEYDGHEEHFNLAKCGFVFSFGSLQGALNWCIEIQLSLLNLNWPQELLEVPAASEVKTESGPLYRGPRVRMSIHVGSPASHMNRESGRMSLEGPMMEKAAQLLSLKSGSIVASSAIIAEIQKKCPALKERIEVEHTISFESDGARLILPFKLLQRAIITPSQPHSPTDREDEEAGGTWTEPILDDIAPPDWLIRWSDLSVIQFLGKGPVGDFSLARWNQREVAIKVLANQKLNDSDQIRLYGDAIVLRQVNHPNLLPLFALCLDPGNVCIVVEYMNKGTLTRVLQEAFYLSFQKLLEIARDIAVGMEHLSNHPDPAVRIHTNFKSGNVLLDSNWEVKICDFGQSFIKDLARTMTSVSDVAWTAPEVLEGNITPKSALYAYGMILWELYMHKVPFTGEHPIKVVTEVFRGYRPPIPIDCPPNYRQLIERCWTVYPEQRPTWHFIIARLNGMIEQQKKEKEKKGISGEVVRRPPFPLNQT